MKKYLLLFLFAASVFADNIVDHSGTIAVANTSQKVMDATPNRHFLYFEAVNADMWINFRIAANEDSPSIKIPSGTFKQFDSNFIPSDIINVICATAGAKYTAKEATR
jgi:hypothetical protein